MDLAYAGGGSVTCQGVTPTHVTGIRSLREPADGRLPGPDLPERTWKTGRLPGDSHKRW